MKKGVDVSEWQEGVKWETLKPDFVIIRAGHGLSQDSELGRNILKAQRLGVPWGVYWCHETHCDGGTEAAAVLTLWSQKEFPTMGIWFDIEPDCVNSQTEYNARKFCKEVEAAGYYAGIYASTSVLDHLDLDEYDKWAASWGTNSGKPEPEAKADARNYGTLWQYTSRLDVNGNNVDGDICFYDDLSFYNRKGEVNGPNMIDILDKMRRLRHEIDNIIKELEAYK